MAVLKYRNPIDGLYHSVADGGQDDRYLPKTGGIMSGPLLLAAADPVAPQEAASKQYVDRAPPRVDLRPKAVTLLTTAYVQFGYTNPFPDTNHPEMWNAGTDTLLKCPWDGLYRLEANIRFDQLATAPSIAVSAGIEVLLNGARWLLGPGALCDGGVGATISSFSMSRYMTAGSSVVIQVKGVGTQATAVSSTQNPIVWTYLGF